MSQLFKSSQTSSRTTTDSGGSRTDIGKGDTNFVPPTAENDRGDGPKFQVLNGLFEHLGGMEGFDAAGLGFGLGFGFGGMFADPLMGYEHQSGFLGEGEEKWGEVEQTTLETLESSNMLKKYGDDAVLVIANGPEDMQQLDHEDEADRIANSRGQGQETVVLWNPSKEALTTMLKEGGFKDVVFSGHGDEGVVYMTGEDGEAVAVSGDELAGMMEDTEVENVFLNVCAGMGGEDSVAQSLSEVGINSIGWTDKVSDGQARSGADFWADLTQDGSDWEDLLTTANAFGGMESRMGMRADMFSGLLSGLGSVFGMDIAGLTPPGRGGAGVLDGSGSTQGANTPQTGTGGAGTTGGAAGNQGSLVDLYGWNSNNFMWM